jgi:pyruvate formate lyase activating enzyme
MTKNTISIGGFNKFSLIDYPGKTCAIIFTQGCNFRCPYCHNPELVLPHLFEQPISLSEVLSFLEKRKGLLEAVEFTGGEPIIQEGLPKIIKKIKKMGYLIKIDSNGSNPDMIKKLIDEQLVDYFAMDIKAPLENYSEACGTIVDVNKIKESINIIMQYAPDYEFRTTAIKKIHTKESFRKIGLLIKGAKRYYLQNAHYDKTVSAKFKNEKTFSKEEMNVFYEEIKKDVKHCYLRI